MGRTVRKQTKAKIKGANVKLASSRAKTGTKPAAKKAAALKPVTKKRRSTKATKLSAEKNASSVKGIRTRDIEKTVLEFKMAVNISRDHLERWLNTPESKKLGFPDEPGGRIAGNATGLKILRILGKRRDKYTSEDITQMRTVIDFVNLRLAKRPKGDIVASNWRYSLMNWGHDPAKKLKRGAR
jgi:hypothetical protein